MLLERIDELPLASHDLRGNPSALLGSIESLLSAVVADGMTGRRHRSNCELVAQGGEGFGLEAGSKPELMAVRWFGPR